MNAINNKEDAYNIASFLATGLLVMGVIFSLMDLVAPLLGGTLRLRGLFSHLCFASLGLAMKYVLKRVGKEMRFGVYEHLVLTASSVVAMFVWFEYPYNIIFSIVGIVMTIISYYKAAKKSKIKQDEMAKGANGATNSCNRVPQMLLGGMMFSKLTDTSFIILVSFISSVLILLIALSIAFVLPESFIKWSQFIVASIIYLGTLIGTGFTIKEFKQLPKAKILLFMIVFYMLTVGIAFSTFKYGLLSLPKESLPYVFPPLVLSGVAVIVLRYLRKKSK